MALETPAQLALMARKLRVISSSNILFIIGSHLSDEFRILIATHVPKVLISMLSVPPLEVLPFEGALVTLCY